MRPRSPGRPSRPSGSVFSRDISTLRVVQAQLDRLVASSDNGGSMTQTIEEPAVQTSPVPTLASERGRLAYIDGLRGLAMLWVLSYHCWVHTIGRPIPVSVGRRHL